MFFRNIRNNTDAEPTRSVLLRSAASLALDCKLVAETEKLICTALVGNPPLEIAEELRDLLENVHFLWAFPVLCAGSQALIHLPKMLECMDVDEASVIKVAAIMNMVEKTTTENSRSLAEVMPEYPDPDTYYLITQLCCVSLNLILIRTTGYT